MRHQTRWIVQVQTFSASMQDYSKFFPSAADAGVPSQEIEERFFTLSIDMLCVLGFDGYFRHLSPSWERTLGFTIDELKSKRFIEFVHPDDRDRTLNQNKDVRGGGQALSF